jgi:hypothetical protein
MTLHAAAIPYFHQCDWGSNVQLVCDEVSDSFLQLQLIKWRLLAECRLCEADISAHLGSGEDLLIGWTTGRGCHPTQNARVRIRHDNHLLGAVQPLKMQ